jgi:hypothetical protein
MTNPVAEVHRLDEDARRVHNWQRWGPYLSERQWGTVREDYSADGTCWDYFPHDQARSRAYRWGEDGLLGICDRECRLAFAIALWNGRDPILKERLFGLTGPEGNHGEDVKECYFYVDATPTSSYLRAMYLYPQGEYPYLDLVRENARRGKGDREYELADTGILDENRYFEVTAEYAKAAPDDILIRITVANRGPDAAPVHLLPTLWFRNMWSWGRTEFPYGPKPTLRADGASRIVAEHHTLGRFVLDIATPAHHGAPDAEPDAQLLFTGNETNASRLFGVANAAPHVKDAFHEYIIDGRTEAVDPSRTGTKAAAWIVRTLAGGESFTVELRLRQESLAAAAPFGREFNATFDQRRSDADEFYRSVLPSTLTEAETLIARQAYAGLLWTKQFYHYVVREWLDGDPSQPRPPESRRHGRNVDWRHVYNRDVLSMPDKWEYPWYAAWDSAFHTLPLSRIDPRYAQQQLVLFLREWYMHPNGQIPAYEFAFNDVNPPVHAWAAWRVYKMSSPRGRRDRVFLARVFQKLMLNFTWWVNRKDLEGNNLFSGGFLGLDNVGVFDRSKPLPTGGLLEQADGTAFMAFFCATMLSMALELAIEDPAYEDVASKFFEHFVAITDAINAIGGQGLWDEEDGFYYDEIHVDGVHQPLRVRSIVGLIPLLACEVIDEVRIRKLPGFRKRMEWFLEHRKDLARYSSYMETAVEHDGGTQLHGFRLLAMPSRERLVRVLRRVLDESEFLSPYGIRSLSRAHLDDPYVFHFDSQSYEVRYDPAESTTGLFGGNSNWRGPVWFPINHLLIEALERYGHFYGDTLRVECPVGSGTMLTLTEVAAELSARLTRLFLPDADGNRPCNGGDSRFAADGPWRDLVLFHEYFHGDSGRGLGASHQTGWTALIVHALESIAATRLPDGVAHAGAPERTGAPA